MYLNTFTHVSKANTFTHYGKVKILCIKLSRNSDYDMNFVLQDKVLIEIEFKNLGLIYIGCSGFHEHLSMSLFLKTLNSLLSCR